MGEALTYQLASSDTGCQDLLLGLCLADLPSKKQNTMWGLGKGRGVVRRR
jgi:hypothetical protein